MMTVLDWSHGTYWSRLGGIGYGKVEVGGPLLYLCLLTKKPAKQFCLVTPWSQYHHLQESVPYSTRLGPPQCSGQSLLLHQTWSQACISSQRNEKVWKWVPRSIAFTSAYLNRCSDFIDLWQTIQASDGFNIQDLRSTIFIVLLKIFISRSIVKWKWVFWGWSIQVYRVYKSIEIEYWPITIELFWI